MRPRTLRSFHAGALHSGVVLPCDQPGVFSPDLQRFQFALHPDRLSVVLSAELSIVKSVAPDDRFAIALFHFLPSCQVVESRPICFAGREVGHVAAWVRGQVLRALANQGQGSQVARGLSAVKPRQAETLLRACETHGRSMLCHNAPNLAARVFIDSAPSVLLAVGRLQNEFAQLRKVFVIQRTATNGVISIIGDVRWIVGTVQIDPGYDAVKTFPVQLYSHLSIRTRMPLFEHVHQSTTMRPPGIWADDLDGACAD